MHGIAKNLFQPQSGSAPQHVVGAGKILLNELLPLAQHIVQLQKNIAKRLPHIGTGTEDTDACPTAADLRPACRSKQIQMGIAGAKQLIGQGRIVKLDGFKLGGTNCHAVV